MMRPPDTERREDASVKSRRTRFAARRGGGARGSRRGAAAEFHGGGGGDRQRGARVARRGVPRLPFVLHRGRGGAQNSSRVQRAGGVSGTPGST